MAKIHVGNVWARATGGATHIEQRLAALEAQMEDWGLHQRDGRFLAGLVPLVADGTTELVDERVQPAVVAQYPKFLRDYQLEAVRAAVRHERGIIKSPTGSGKTAIGGGLIAALPLRWAYLVPAPSLAAAVAAWLHKQLGEPVGEVHGGVRRFEGRILVATYDGIHSSPQAAEFLSTAEGLVLDEVHRVATKTAFPCVLWAQNAFYRIGLSATPLDRSDDKNAVVVGLVGPIIHEIPLKKLEEAGHVAKLVFHWVHVHQEIDYRGPWSEFYDEHIVRSRKRDVGLAIIATEMPTPGLVLVKTRAHARILHEMIQARAPDRRVAVVNGDVPVEERTKLIDAINNETVDVVIATKVFFEGIDAPEIASVVPATGYQSVIEAIQIAGRGSRPTSKKKFCCIFEIADSGHPWLEKHTLARYEAYRAAGYDLPHPWPGYRLPQSSVTVLKSRVISLVSCALFALLVVYLVLR